MTLHRLTLTVRAAAVAALLLPAAVACGTGDAADDTAASAPAASSPPGVARDTGTPEEIAESSPPAAPEGMSAFDPEAIPVSDVPLGEFPYLEIPEGFENTNTEIPISVSDSVPFWTGDDLEWVEGKVYQSPIFGEGSGEFSRPNLLVAVESAVDELGGVLVADSPIPGTLVETIPDDLRVDYVDGFGDIYNDPVQTYVIRRADSMIWIHLCSNSAGAGWMIAESAA
ncbi:hypothetical protein [Nocardiopsis sp. CC223A]|uniref:hypothetical protein n=1 Tax=Nocardiopsis sp. CC223A TaxID=3044051 RepID=UPI00278C293D|nr:hypothetical protein [Nocardiopsis sp. CC223A]